MPAGQPAGRPACPGRRIAQQPGRPGGLRVLARAAVRSRRRRAGVLWGEPDRGPRPLVQAGPDRIDHRPARPRVGRGEVLDRGVAGPGAVDGGQQVAPPLRGDRGDRGAGDRDVAGGGARPGVARAMTASNSPVLPHHGRPAHSGHRGTIGAHRGADAPFCASLNSWRRSRAWASASLRSSSPRPALT